MNLSNSLIKSSLAVVLCVSMVGCSKDDGPSEGGRTSNEVEFFIAATESGEGAASYLLSVPDVSAGTVGIKGQGLEADAYTAWLFPNQYTGIGLKYQKGDPGIGIGVGLGADGNIVRTGGEFQIESRFTTYGVFQNKVLTAVGGVQVADAPDIYTTFNFVDPAKNNAVTTITENTTNLTGNGEYATLSGIVQFGDNEFLTALVPSTVGGDTGSGGGSTGPTQYPDSVWVAAYDQDLQVKRIYGDDRLGYAAGKFRSQYYSSISEDGKGNVYVFSPSNDATSTKPAGVIRINAGADDFDQDYFWNLEDELAKVGAATDIKFQRVFHVTDDVFVLAYVRNGSTVQEGPAKPNALAIINVVDKSFKWVEGLPDFNDNPSFGLPIAEDGKLYIPVNEVDHNPAIYTVDAVTGKATKGLVVEAGEVTAIGKLHQ